MTRPIIIDTDPGCDDALAIALALESDALEVAGLTTIFGNGTTAATTRNARAILELFDRTDVPIAKGCQQPLLCDLETAEHIHGDDGIKGELPTPTPATEPVDTHAAQFIIEQARKHEGELTLVAIGRLTNVALALALEPALPELLREVVIMGGSAFVSGNVTPLASANFYGDPHAARRVVRDCNPQIVPVDVTRYATLPLDWIDSLPRDHPKGGPVYEWATYYEPAVLERYGIETAAIHDALAMASLIDDGILEWVPYYVEVGSDSGLAQGALVVDGHGTTEKEPNTRVALEAEYDRYREIVTTALERLVAQ